MRIIYEDKNVVVADKPAGVIVHMAWGVAHEKTLVHKLAKATGDAILPVHRLDKDTSGVIIFAKNIKTRDFLQKQFKDRQVKKVYLALVKGVPKLKEAILDWPIGRHPKNPLKRAVRPSGKPAVTKYKVKQTFGDKYALLEVYPKTGRAHQIRVHMAKLGHSVVGDATYGHSDPGLKRHWLHAAELTLKLPDGKPRTFKSPLAAELQRFLERLEG